MPAVAGLSPEQADKTAQLRLLLAQMLAPQMPPAQIEPGAPMPPSGGFADTVSPTQPLPNAGASNMAIQPGGKGRR